MGDKDPSQTVPDEVMAQYRAESSEPPAAAVDLRTAGMEVVELPDVIPPANATPRVDTLEGYDRTVLDDISRWLGKRR